MKERKKYLVNPKIYRAGARNEIFDFGTVRIANEQGRLLTTGEVKEIYYAFYDGLVERFGGERASEIRKKLFLYLMW